MSHGDLRLATREFPVWTVETVDVAGGTGQYPSLADSADDPAVAYYDAINGDLRYARRSGGRWVLAAVDTADWEQ